MGLADGSTWERENPGINSLNDLKPASEFPPGTLFRVPRSAHELYGIGYVKTAEGMGICMADGQPYTLPGRLGVSVSPSEYERDFYGVELVPVPDIPPGRLFQSRGAGGLEWFIKLKGVGGVSLKTGRHLPLTQCKGKIMTRRPPTEPEEEIADTRRVETDPNGLAPGQPGAKLDQGKLLAGILDDFAPALLEVVKVGTFGATNKYSRGGWKSVENGIQRYEDAAGRHHLYRALGEEFDKDSGLLHEAHECWNRLATLTLKLQAHKESHNGNLQPREGSSGTA